MNTVKKESYVQPVLVKHALLRDITAKASGKGNCGFGNGGSDGVPGNSGCQDVTR
jgi:hypothetical protein